MDDRAIPDLGRLGGVLERRLPEFLDDLEALVNVESGSYTKAGVDRVSGWMAGRLAALGAFVERRPHEELGDTVIATLGASEPGPSVLLLGHADTVFEPGSLQRRPFEVRDGRIHGPGAIDMKSGLLVGIYALEAIRTVTGEKDPWPRRGRLVFVINPDEEIGSPTSTPIITELARGVDAALVLEGARADGAIVTERKGVKHYVATVRGRAAHAGVEPETGRNAVLEAAHKAVALDALNGRWDGVSVVVGALNGGTRPNIVPDEAVLRVDMRARTRADQAAAMAAIGSILDTSTIAETTTSVETGADWLPMERSEASGRLFDLAAGIAAEIGFDLAEAATGGGSDANTTAALGVPTLDGLGPIGGKPHTPEEYVELDSIVPRTTLVAGLLLALARR